MARLDATGREQVDKQRSNWRQGDCTVGENWFLFRTDAEGPLTRVGADAAIQDLDSAETVARGFAVVTRTSVLIRCREDRRFAEVCPLVRVGETVVHEIKRGRRPYYGYIPGVARDRLVADLDRVMTVEKVVVAKWERIRGCGTDDDARRLSIALARKRARMAFPDDFVEFASPLMRRMSSKHDKQTDEGRALRSLREIRARAAPSWDADAVELMFWFIRGEYDSRSQDRIWDYCLSTLPEAQRSPGRFVRVDGAVQTLDDLTARASAGP